jgi:peptide/nickel transport system substrate-binding protein
MGVAALAVALLLPAAGSSRGIKEGGTFRVGIPGEVFDSIDWAKAEFPAPFVALRPTCASLLTFPDKPFPAGRRLVPELASDYPKISNGGRTYTFTIRKGVRFSTGAPVTAQDVAHTINRLLDPG